MVRHFTFIIFVVLGFLQGCAPVEEKTEEMDKEEEKPVEKVDQHSFAIPEEAVMTFLDLYIEVDFSEKVIKGTAKITFENHSSNRLFLDTKGLFIESVKVGDREVKFTLHEEIPFMGSALEIEIDTFTNVVEVNYKTSADAPALQWLSAAQTSGKRHPFLFTQSQAILARSWVPCQDSPGIRFPYSATVTVPKNLMALMSAENPQEKNDSGIYHFKMSKPIPAYLLALAVGDIDFKSLGSRTGVYAEPSMLKKSADEFEDLEKMLTAAEKLYGPYKWGRYDLIVLPPSFPFGGMENPRLTFATPTIIAGDKSLTSLVAHELAHSWSGNLVTNATWDDFWLNEGFTVYFENRIMEEVYGKEIAKMLSLISYQDLQAEMEGMNYSEDTRLKLNLKGRDPDDGMTSIAYDKGYYFLKLIEETVGRENWDAFLNQYFSEKEFQAISTEDFLAYLKENLLDKHPGAEEKLKINKWVYSAGLPENCPVIQSDKFEKVEMEIVKFMDGEKARNLNTNKWTYQQWVHFIRKLSDSVSISQMSELDLAFHFTNTGNNEVLFEWLMLAVKKEYKPAYPKMEYFLKSVGRRKFIAPLYKAMAENPAQINLGKRIYKQAKSNYHFVAVNTIDTYFSEQ
ncbi:M1 family metallopeptidase [Flexithrix dorotheae]|uniref:M1 family metallopeptidase n=1 Tax=Flexithrix dorotheae TaxID=70993 RepID=UPI000369F573|nr:M1 family metallopeptidase [Flexithrix dorotheae]